MVMVSDLALAKEAEAKMLAELDPAVVEAEVKAAAEDYTALKEGVSEDTKFNDIFKALPTNSHGVLAPEFWRYYRRPWTPIFFDYDDPYNDLVTILWGPRGGGKTISGVSKNIIDGQMRGIECVSNVPFSWVAKDINGYVYKIESIPFDQEKFAYGDLSYKYKRLQIDEGNYLADRLRSTSKKNLAMTDILQQARKFRMCVDFCTINWMWLDPRVTGSLTDLLIECNDLYYKGYGRKHGMRKGHRIAWDIEDQSGKISGKQFHHLASTTFNARSMWMTYNTENFVNPQEARKKLKEEEKTVFDEFGNEITEKHWLASVGHKLQQLSNSQIRWTNHDLWEALGIEDQGMRIKAGRFMANTLGVTKRVNNKLGRAYYDLSTMY